MPSESGRLLAGRYRLTGRPEGSGVPGRRRAVDTATGLRVVLEATPLPEVVGAELVDDPAAHPGDPAGHRARARYPRDRYGDDPYGGDRYPRDRHGDDRYDDRYDDGDDTVYADSRRGAAFPAASPAAPPAAAARAVDHAARVADAVPSHPRLLQVFEVFDQDGFLWVAGEHLPGVPLARLLERGPLPVHRAAEVASDVLGALRAVHAAGIVHGNVTPETVLVCEDGTAMLGGLSTGAAQETLCGGPGADLPGAAVPPADWTPARLRARDVRAGLAGPRAERWAPEQAGPRPSGPQPAGPAPQPGAAVGPPADAWAVGVLLFRMAAGRAPFPEDGTAALLDAVRAGRPAADRSCGPLAPLVDALLHPDPAARPAPAQARQRLGELLARAPEPYDPDAAGVAALLPAVRPAAPLERRRRGGAPVPRPGRPPAPARHARSGARPGLLGPLLVGGLLLAVLAVLLGAALLSG
ncbi:hypothetical protein [Streptomyces sp. NPDC001380]|uniref:hypothetical protein n=1 Tax=Streptomyces sp. NPDC001380 TaxID=3364566 RepID=UPI00367BE3EC